MRALTLGLLVLLPLLAGCTTPAGPGPGGPGTVTGAARVCAVANGTSLCNYLATVEPETRQANELSIAVNPTDPRNIIATGKDYTPEHAGDCVYAAVYATLDGGLTWKDQNLPGSPWKRLNDPSEPMTQTSGFWCATDPVVAFGPDGTAYWTVMPYQCDRASGSKTGRDVLPQGGFNDWFWTCSAMYVLVSTDGGLTWPTLRRVAVGPRLEHDKQWLSAAPNGDVLLCWDRAPEAPVNTPVPLPAGPSTVPGAGDSGIVCSKSTDKGQSWSDMAYMSKDTVLPWIDYGPDNVAWSANIDGSKVRVFRSADGLAWEEVGSPGGFENPPAGGEYGWPVLRGSDFRTFTVPSLAVDRSNGTYAGSVYVTWFDHSAGEGDVLLSYSRDNGATWSPPKRVHDDDAAKKADQFMPAVSVGPDGTVDLSWLDRRDDPDNHLFDLYYTYSLDGGATLAKNLRVSDVSSDEQYSHHQNGMVFLGDYRDSDSSPGQAHLVWTDTRNQKADVFIATIERPGTNAGPTS